MAAEIRDIPQSKENVGIPANIFVIKNTGEVVEIKRGEQPPKEEEIDLQIVVATDEKGEKFVSISTRSNVSEASFLEAAYDLQNNPEIEPNPDFPSYTSTITHQAESMVAKGSELLSESNEIVAVQTSGPKGSFVLIKNPKTGDSRINYSNKFKPNQTGAITRFVARIGSGTGVNEVSVTNVLNQASKVQHPLKAAA